MFFQSLRSTWAVMMSWWWCVWHVFLVCCAGTCPLNCSVLIWDCFTGGIHWMIQKVQKNRCIRCCILLHSIRWYHSMAYHYTTQTCWNLSSQHPTVTLFKAKPVTVAAFAPRAAWQGHGWHRTGGVLVFDLLKFHQTHQKYWGFKVFMGKNKKIIHP